MKQTRESSDSNVSGREVRFEFDLALDKAFPDLVVDMLGFSKASIEVFCGAGTGAVGNGALKQRNTVNGPGVVIPGATTTVAFTESAKTSAFGLVDITGRYLVIDLSAVTFGAAGRVTVLVVQKI